MIRTKSGIDRATARDTAQLLPYRYALLMIVLVSGCTTDPYFEPSASEGTIGYPPPAGSQYGIFPKNTIYFSPPNYPVISVSVTAWSDHTGNPRTLQIGVGKLYWSDPRIKKLPYDQAQAEIARDREEVVTDATFVEVDWSDGKRQVVPLSFSREVGSSRFVISGEPVAPIFINGQPSGPAVNPLHPEMFVPLGGNNSSAFDVKIPAMSFSGHRLDLPVIHFRKVG